MISFIPIDLPGLPLHCLMLNILVLPYVIYLSNDLRHKHLLSDKPDDKHADVDECLAQTTDVSHESQQIVDFALVSVIHLVATHVNCDEVVFSRGITKVVVIGFHVEDLVES